MRVIDMIMMIDIGIESAIAYMTMMMDMEGAIAIFTTMRVIEMTMVMDMTTMIDIGRVIAKLVV